jgi:hypothetical protein
MLKTKSAYKSYAATIIFTCRNGCTFASSMDFVIKPSKSDERASLMHVAGFPVRATRGHRNARIHGVIPNAHLGFMPCEKLSRLRIFRKLVQLRLDDPKFLKKLEQFEAGAAYCEALERVAQLRKDLVSAKADFLITVKEIVQAKKNKPVHFVIPLIK